METCTHIADDERCNGEPTMLNAIGRPTCARHGGVSYAQLAEENKARRLIGLPAL